MPTRLESSRFEIPEASSRPLFLISSLSFSLITIVPMVLPPVFLSITIIALTGGYLLVTMVMNRYRLVKVSTGGL